MALQTSVVELTAMQQLVEDIRKGNDISFLNDEHIGHYLAIERKQRELISAQRYIDGFNKAKEKMYSDEQVIELIQFLSMDKDFNGYGSVYKETARYFLEKFKKQ